jgi:hypothetical protein
MKGKGMLAFSSPGACTLSKKLLECNVAEDLCLAEPVDVLF